MRAMLIGSAGPLAGREFNLDAPVVTLGRRDENDIVIKDPTISRKHAEIRQDGDDLVLRDNGSTSGTMVNGSPLTGEHRLRDGDTIIIGSNATFIVQMHPDDSATVAFSRDAFMAPSAPPSAPEAHGAAEPWSQERASDQQSSSPAYPPASSGHSEPPVAPHWENAPADAGQTANDQPWGSPPPRFNAEPPPAPNWSAAPPAPPEPPAPQWGSPPGQEGQGAAAWGQAPPSGPPTAAADWGGPPVGHLNFPGEQEAGGTMVGGPGMAPPRPGEGPPQPLFNTPPPGISGPPPGFGPPPGGQGQPGFGAGQLGQQPGFGSPPGPAPQGSPPSFGPPPSPGGQGHPGMMPPQVPPPHAKTRSKGPLVAILLLLLIVIVVAVAVLLLVLKNRSSAGAVAPLVGALAPVARALLDATS